MIRRRGDNWEVVVYAGRDPITGKERRVSRTVTGRPGQKRPPAEAKKVEAKLLLEVAEGHHRTRAATVGELLDRWLVHVRPSLSPTTTVGYERCIRLYLRPRLGTVRLDRLTTATLDRFYATLQTSGGRAGAPLSAMTVRHVHAVLRAAVGQAVTWGWVDRNVVANASPPRVPRSVIEAPTAATIARLFAGAAADVDLTDFLALAVVSGARRGELCGLRWRDVELDGDEGSMLIARAAIEVDHVVSIKGPKHGVRRIALGPRVVRRLRARRLRLAAQALAFGTALGEDAYVFSEVPDGAAPMRPDLATYRFRGLARRLGVKVRLHDLRHAAVTDALADGHAVSDVAEFVGHASAKMTLDVYGHAIPARSRAIAATLDRRIG